MGGWVGFRVGFININDMYKMTVGKGVVYAYEAYEVKKRVSLVRVTFYFISLCLPVTDSHLVHIYTTTPC